MENVLGAIFFDERELVWGASILKLFFIKGKEPTLRHFMRLNAEVKLYCVHRSHEGSSFDL